MRQGLKVLLAWNIILTVVLIAGFLGSFLVQNRFINLTNERIFVVSESLKEMSDVLNEHAEVINGHTGTINEHANLMNGEYLVAIEANQELMNDMAKLISEYQKTIDNNAIYFGDILENLRDLSMTFAY